MKKLVNFMLCFCLMTLCGMFLAGCEKKDEYDVRANFIYSADGPYGSAYTDDDVVRIHDDYKGVTVKRGEDLYFYVEISSYYIQKDFKVSIAGVPLQHEGYYYNINGEYVPIEDGEEVDYKEQRAYKYEIKNIVADITVDVDFSKSELMDFEVDIDDKYKEGAMYGIMNQAYSGPAYITSESVLYDENNPEGMNLLKAGISDFPQDDSLKVKAYSYAIILIKNDKIGRDNLYYSHDKDGSSYSFSLNKVSEDWNGYTIYSTVSMTKNCYIGEYKLRHSEPTISLSENSGCTKLFYIDYERNYYVGVERYINIADAAEGIQFNDINKIEYNGMTLSKQSIGSIASTSTEFIYMGDDATNAGGQEFNYIFGVSRPNFDTVCSTIYYVFDYSVIRGTANDLIVRLWSADREMCIELQPVEYKNNKAILAISKETVKPIYDRYVDLTKSQHEKQQLVAGVVEIGIKEQYINESLTGFKISYDDACSDSMLRGEIKWFLKHDTLKPVYYIEDYYNKNYVLYYKRSDLFDGEDYIGGEFKVSLGGGSASCCSYKAMYSTTSFDIYEAGSNQVSRLTGGRYTTDCLAKTIEELATPFTLTDGQINKMFEIKVNNTRVYEESYHNLDFSKFDFEKYDLYATKEYPYKNVNVHEDIYVESVFEKVDANTTKFKLKAGETIYFVATDKQGKNVMKMNGEVVCAQTHDDVHYSYLAIKPRIGNFWQSSGKAILNGEKLTIGRIEYDDSAYYFKENSVIYIVNND